MLTRISMRGTNTCDECDRTPTAVSAQGHRLCSRHAGHRRVVAARAPWGWITAEGACRDPLIDGVWQYPVNIERGPFDNPEA